MAPLPSKPSELKRVVSKGVNQKVRSLSNRQRSRLSDEDEDNGREAFLGSAPPSTFARGQEPPAGFTQDASHTSSMGVHRNGSQMPQGYGYGAPPPPLPPGAHGGGGRSAEEQEEIDLALAVAASMATHEQESRAPPRVSADSAAEADEEEQLRRALELSKLEDTTRRPLLASSPLLALLAPLASSHRLLPRLLARATRSPCSQLLIHEHMNMSGARSPAHTRAHPRHTPGTPRHTPAHGPWHVHDTSPAAAAGSPTSQT